MRLTRDKAKACQPRFFDVYELYRLLCRQRGAHDRYDKTAEPFLGFITIAAIKQWLPLSTKPSTISLAGRKRGGHVTDISWQKFEADIREVARLKWGVEPQQKVISGVKFDCVLELSWDHLVIVEITKNNTLDKVRGDINRLALARTACFTQENIYVEAFIVLSGIVTAAMLSAGEAVKVKVSDRGAFQRFLFDHKQYAATRRALQFGSAVDPITGRPDTASYVPVLYSRTRDARRMNVTEIGRLLTAGHSIILTGEYGAGKSRCVKEIFDILAASSETPLLLSIDLRRSWGLTSGAEIVRRHLEEVGMVEQAH